MYPSPKEANLSLSYCNSDIRRTHVSTRICMQFLVARIVVMEFSSLNIQKSGTGVSQLNIRDHSL